MFKGSLLGSPRPRERETQPVTSPLAPFRRAPGRGRRTDMGYVIAGIIVLLLVAGFITYLVMNATQKRSSTAGGDTAPGIGSDATPLGDTTEHAGDQTERGTTASDAERNLGDEHAGEDPPQPRRPEDRQMRDAGASRH